MNAFIKAIWRLLLTGTRPRGMGAPKRGWFGRCGTLRIEALSAVGWGGTLWGRASTPWVALTENEAVEGGTEGR